MKIEYRGKNLKEDRKYPEAYITYDEKLEQKKFDEIFLILVKQGYEIYCEEGCAVIPLHLGKVEYKEFVENFKKAKKEILDSIECCANCKYCDSTPKNNSYGDMENFCLINGYYLFGINKDRTKIKRFTPGGKELECRYERRNMINE